MEVIHEIKYDGKKYTVYEPTIDIWQEMMVAKEFKTDFELAITILTWVTGLSLEEIREAETYSIINAADGIVDYFTNQSKEFFDTFTFADKTYKFIDLPTMTFGEYVDIDDVLNKPTSERHRSLSLLMALLYKEVDENGEYLPYDIERVKKNAELFKKLPIKYVNGATVFFYLMESMLEKNTQFSILTKEWWILRWRLAKRTWKKMTRSVGIVLSTVYQGRIFLMLTRSRV